MADHAATCADAVRDEPGIHDVTDVLVARAAAAGCSVRPVRDADADQLADLIGGVFDEYPGCVLDLDGIDADLRAWATHLTTRGGAGWVLVGDDGRLVACVGVTPTDALPAGAASVREAEPEPTPDTAVVELKRLYVHADARRGGIGRALVGRVESWARSRGGGAVVLWSDTRFTDAHRLYARLGYDQLAARRHLDDPSDTTEVAFVRWLDERAGAHDVP